MNEDLKPFPVSGADPSGQVEALRMCGAADFDPVGFRVIEAMLRRLDTFDGPARAALLHRTEHRVAALRARFEALGGVSRAAPTRVLPARPLTALLAHLAGYCAVDHESASSGPVGTESSTELKSLRYFRSTWVRLDLEQQLSRALAQAPENAGPLNSHHLLLQALIRMRALAPSYLENFMSYVEALIWLDQADAGRGGALRAGSQKAPARKAAAGRLAARKRPPARGKTR